MSELEPVVADVDERGWETVRGEGARGPVAVFYKTLISGDLTRSEALTVGVAKLARARRSRSTVTLRPRSTSCSRARGRSGSATG